MIAATEQPKVNIKALAATILFHALLLLIFFLWQYSIPVSSTDILAGDGLEVNLGNSPDGSGNDQPMSVNDPANYSAAVVYKNSSSSASTTDKVVSSDHPDNVALQNNKKQQHSTPVADNQPKEPKPIPRAVYTGAPGNTTGGNNAQNNAPGTSEGNTTGGGDRGVPGGTPGAANYTGTPGSGGIGHTLSGRSISPDRFEAEFREGGKVVISVTVDREGNIVSKRVKSSSNPQLTKLAMDKLARAKFSRSNSSEPQQFGDVTIIFKTR